MSIQSFRLLVLLAALAGSSRTAYTAGACAVLEGDEDGNGTTDLRLLGTGGRQNAVVLLKNAGYQVKLDCDSNGSFNDTGDVVKSGTATIETYSVELGGGGDTITIHQDEDLAAANKDLQVILGPGKDKITYQTAGHSIVTSSNLEIQIVGGTQSAIAVLDFTGSAITQSRVVVRADLGPAADTLHVLGPANATGSVVDLGFRLGQGSNHLLTTDGGGVLSSSTLKVHVEGSAGSSQTAPDDTVVAQFSGRIDGRSRLDYSANLNSGNDRWTGAFDLRTFDIDPTAAAGSEAYLDLKGNGGADTLKVTSNSTFGPATINGLLSILIDGSSQGDVLALDWGGITGTGKLRFWADGGMAWDRANVSITATNSSRNDLDIYASGGPENDIGSPHGDSVTFDITNSGQAKFGAGGKAVLDGGLDGVDTCRFTGNAPRLAINCEAGSW